MPETTDLAKPTRRQQALAYAKLCALLAAGVLAYLHLVAPSFSWMQGRPSSLLVWNPGPGLMTVRTTNLFFFNAGVQVPPGSIGRFSAHIGTNRTVKLRIEANGSSTCLQIPTSPARTVWANPVPLWGVTLDRQQLQQLAVQPRLALWLEQLAAGKPGEAERLACTKKLQADLHPLCLAIEIAGFADDGSGDLAPAASPDRPVATPTQLILPDPQWLRHPWPLADGQIAIRSGQTPRLMVTLTIPWGKKFPGLGNTDPTGSQLTVIVICEGELAYAEAKLARAGQELCPPLHSK